MHCTCNPRYFVKNKNKTLLLICNGRLKFSSKLDQKPSNSLVFITTLLVLTLDAFQVTLDAFQFTP
jgi:hypothetical protein